MEAYHQDSETPEAEMDVPQGLTPNQTAAAAIAEHWTTSADAVERLHCQYCWSNAESDAIENGASEDDEIMWAAQYISQGDSSPCWRHTDND